VFNNSCSYKRNRGRRAELAALPESTIVLRGDRSLRRAMRAGDSDACTSACSERVHGVRAEREQRGDGALL